MKFFVTGVSGQLGHDVMNELIGRGYEAVGSDLQPSYGGVQDGSAVCAAPYVSLDITDADAVSKVIAEADPDAVIHCAAWTAVDAAEDADKVDRVRAINAGGTRNIAQAVKKINTERKSISFQAAGKPGAAFREAGKQPAQAGKLAGGCSGEPEECHPGREAGESSGNSAVKPCKMTYISTDYIFDGQGTDPWKPDCRDYAPLNVYGQTKLEGEQSVAETLSEYFIVRIAWVFGLNGKNFIRTMLKIGKTHGEVRVVDDQIGTPTYTLDLARLLVDMNETEKYGYYHATNEGGYISWYEFTKEIYRQAGYSTKVTPVTTEEYGLSKAKRPFNSRLDKSKLAENGFRPLPTWQDALRRYLAVLKERGEY